jgi:DNA repair exonuclease SbcCD ATPase subunit
MKIINFKFKNFGSYGNKEQTIILPENGSLFIVKGNNGGGKSTISNALKYGLYGKIDKIKLSDIPNRMNKNCAVEVNIEKNGVIYKIKRGIAPSYLQLWIGDIEYDQSGKKNIQEFIEEEILEMPYYLFNNSLNLSINDFKSFITMNPNDKRMIMDRIFGLEILNDIKKYISIKTKEIRDLINEHNIKLTTMNESNSKILIELDNLSKELEKNKLKNIEDWNKSITNKINDINKFTNEIKIWEDEYNKNLELYNKANDLLKQLQFKEKETKNKINLLQRGKCPTCGSALDTEFHISLLQDLLKNNEKILTNIELVNQKISNRHLLLGDSRKKINEVNQKITQLNSEINEINKKINEVNQSKEEKIAPLQNILETNKNQIKEIETVNKKEKKRLKIYSIIEEMFGDNGIKKLSIQKILPLLNNEVKKTLNDLNIPFSILFNPDFTVSIKQYGFDVNTEQLSTGEKKKIDFSVLISIIRFLKIRYQGINIIYLDEIFSSIDSDGIYHIILLLKKVSLELNLNIFVINHGSLPNELFDYQINVEKDNFSKLTIEKLN